MPKFDGLRLLDEQPGLPRFDLPEDLERLYGGPLGLDEPLVYTNFVETIDGVVAIPEVARSNALVAQESDADRFVMGLLRACADVVLIGTGTLLASPKGSWRPEKVYPAAGDLYAELRASRGRSERPAVAIVTSGASLLPAHPVLEHAIVLTTERGLSTLSGHLPDVVAVNDGDLVDLRAAIAELRARGHSLVLSEGGPHVFGSLLKQRCVDELFLTISPVLAGRGADLRFGLAEGGELLPETTAKAELLSARRHGEHLFLRYRL